MPQLTQDAKNSEMDDLHLREIQSLTERARAKLHPDEFRAVVTLARLQIQDQLEETKHRTHEWLTEIVEWLCFPYSAAKKWGLIYAIDMPRLHDERNLEQTAKMIGCTRAAISVQMRQFASIMQLEPSRWMRDDDAVENSREARIKHCKDDTL